MNWSGFSVFAQKCFFCTKREKRKYNLLSRPKKCYFHSPLYRFWLTMKALDWVNILHCTKTRNLSVNQVNGDYSLQWAELKYNVQYSRITSEVLKITKTSCTYFIIDYSSTTSNNYWPWQTNANGRCVLELWMYSFTSRVIFGIDGLMKVFFWAF